MVSNPKTIRDLLEDACQEKNFLGIGGFGRVYGLDWYPELEDYALRVAYRGNQMPHEVLRKTSSLHPPGTIITGANLGQPLLVGETAEHVVKPAVSLLLRQHGTSLEKLEKQFQIDFESQNASHSPIRARVALRKMIAEAAERTGTNPILPLVALEDALQAEGWVPQMDVRNILFDRKTDALKLVDQTNVHIQNDAMLESTFATRHMLADHTYLAYNPDADLSREHEEISAVMKRLVENARSEYLDQCQTGNVTPPFGVSTTHSVKAIGLHHPPKALVQYLKKMHAECDLPTGR